MYAKIYFNEFAEKINSVLPNGFSEEGLKVLYDYFTNLTKEIGDIELDPIAIATEWNEYTSKKEIEDEFGMKMDDLKKYVTILQTKNSYIVNLLDIQELELNKKREKQKHFSFNGPDI